MKKSTKYLIARLSIMALCMVLGFGLGWISKETEVVEVNITRPIVRVNCDMQGVEPIVNYTKMNVVATAYCPCEKCCGKNDGITATGIKAMANHTVAADPNILPYGTKIKCGYGEFVVEDTGGALKGKNRLDFFFDTHEEAVEFGRQEITIWVKEDIK